MRLACLTGCLVACGGGGSAGISDTTSDTALPDAVDQDTGAMVQETDSRDTGPDQPTVILPRTSIQPDELAVLVNDAFPTGNGYFIRTTDSTRSVRWAEFERTRPQTGIPPEGLR